MFCFSVIQTESFLQSRAEAGYFQDNENISTENKSLARNQHDQLYTIPLQKQNVPVYKGDQMIGYKTSYFGPIFVTGRKDPYNVVFDTGSGHVILPSSTCRDEACMQHRQYDRRSSATATSIAQRGSIKQGINVKITFGTGKVNGEFVNDVVCLDGNGQSCMSINLVTATNMTDDPFKLFEFDGIFGLGLKPLALNPEFNFFEEASTKSPTIKPQFAVFLAFYGDEQSSITFGGYDRAKAMTELSWVPVARGEMGYWQVPLDSVRIGNTTLDLCADRDCFAILDTGSSMLGVPNTEIKTLHRLLSREVPESFLNEKIDCRQVPGEDLIFDIGGFQVVLSVQDLAKPDPWNVTQASSNGDREPGMFCRHMLLPVNIKQPVGPKIFVWGQPVLRRYYSVFDVARQMVGMAQAAHHVGQGHLTSEFR